MHRRARGGQESGHEGSEAVRPELGGGAATFQRSGLATGLPMLVLLGLTSVQGQKAETGSRARELDFDAVAVRLLLGVGDTEPDTWGGSVEVDKGEVVGLEGWRFR